MIHDKSDQIEAPDMACLRQFVRDASQEAFTALVQRRIDMVYSAALRQVNDRALAEDVTQVVFITLARKAPDLVHRDVVLSAWLFRTTHLAALDALRRERRRRKHEQHAAMINPKKTITEPDESTWDDVRPLLDAALMGLSEKDRRAIALRFFEGRSVREIGSLQGISEDAARQRLWRATERLRVKLATRGVTPSALGLASVLSAHAVQAAPASLADAAAHAAFSAVAAKAAIPLSLKGAIQLMAWTKAQMTGAVAVAALLVGGTTATVIYVNRPPTERQIVLTPGAPPPTIRAPGRPAVAPASPMTPDMKDRFDQAYALDPGQNLKHVQPPFIPERDAYFQSVDPHDMFNMKDTSSIHVFLSDGHHTDLNQWNAAKSTVGQVVHDVFGVPTYKLDMLPADYNRAVFGDWVVRRGVPLEAQFEGLSKVVLDEQQAQIRFEKREGIRPVLIATGRVTCKPLNPDDLQTSGMRTFLVHFYLGKPPKKPNGMAIGDRGGLLRAIGEALGREVIYDDPEKPAPATQGSLSYMWSNHLHGNLSQEQIAQAAKNIGDQLGLTFALDQRKVSYWSSLPPTESASGN